MLLSYEYLEKSQFLMYGKEHPRIHPLDLLNIRIPLPDLDTQRKIVTDIQKQQKINEKAKERIAEYRRRIDDLIIQTISY